MVGLLRMAGGRGGGAVNASRIAQTAITVGSESALLGTNGSVRMLETRLSNASRGGAIPMDESVIDSQRGCRRYA